jgi:protein CpxP
MTAISSNRVASVAVAALLYLPAAALAQSSQPPSSAVPEGAKPTAAQSSPLAGHPVAGKTAKERVEQRIKELYSQLRITPAERPQWDQFVQVMRENARDMDQAWLQRVDRFQSMNAVQNIQSYQQIAEQHAQDVQKLAAAFQNLYNAMPDQQKQLADQVFRANAERQAQTHRAPNG